tara:strand:+ start:12139 stop:13044 length:906 start_codon:yes stop_codon:yes gene_type:complete
LQTVLKKNDSIYLVAPSGIFNPSLLQQSNRYLNKHNLTALYHNDVLNPHMHFANDDAFRFQDLKRALLQKQAKYLWAFRGGSGAQRLLPYLQRMQKPKQEKILIGFSDVSFLQNYFALHWGWRALHAPVMNRLARGLASQTEEKRLWSLLKGSDNILKGLRPMNEKANKQKQIKGKIIGGNLTTLQASLGSPLNFRASGKILFLEDVAEAPYRIDRALVSLKQAGVLRAAKAIVFGGFTDCQHKAGTPSIQKELQSFANECSGIPIYRGIKVGHGAIQMPLWINHFSILKDNKLIQESPLK